MMKGKRKPGNSKRQYFFASNVSYLRLAITQILNIVCGFDILTATQCYSFLVNDLVVDVTNPQLTELVIILNYCVGPCIFSIILNYRIHVTNHFITLVILQKTREKPSHV